jgi:hypothetical protein
MHLLLPADSTMANDFAIGTYPQSSVLVVYSDRKTIQLDPDYQRIGGIWTPQKKMLLIDSLVNGFDVPKLYFHEFVPFKQIGHQRYRYAIIDGRQRLQTIWDFIDGEIRLDSDFKYLRDSSVKAGGMSYAELALKYPAIKNRFDATTLDIVTVRTDDIELIEEMFTRLNEAVSLNAPEKRNAFGAPLPHAIKEVAKHVFFTKHVPFGNGRYRHLDLAAKFLYLEHEGKVVNTKKQELDDFVREFKSLRDKNNPKASPAAVAALKGKVDKSLTAMSKVFNATDGLLGQVGMITIYYHLFRLIEAKRVGAVKREMLKKFDQARQQNRELAEAAGESGAGVNLKLLEFDRHSQTPNDAYAISIRLRILLEFLSSDSQVQVDKKLLKELQPTS